MQTIVAVKKHNKALRLKLDPSFEFIKPNIKEQFDSRRRYISVNGGEIGFIDVRLKTLKSPNHLDELIANRQQKREPGNTSLRAPSDSA